MHFIIIKGVIEIIQNFKIKKHVKEIFGDYVVYSENTNDLYDKLVDASKTITSDFIKDSMNYVSKNHTYENRIKNLINLIWIIGF